MNIILLLIINTILVFTPIMTHEYFTLHIQNMKKEKITILLSITLFVSSYLSYSFKEFIPISYHFTTLLLIFAVSLLLRREKESIIIFIIASEYLIRVLNYNVFSLVILITSILYMYYKFVKTNKDNMYLVNRISFVVLTVYILNEYKSNIMDLFIASTSFYVFLFIINKSIIISKDIINLHSNLKEFEKEKSIKTSLFKITHEIKNPIAVIKGYIDMFNPYDSEKSKRYIDIMSKEIDRTLNLLTDFMEFSKIKVVKEKVDINVLFDDVKDVLIPFFNAKNVSSFFEVEEDIYINLDYKRMKQVIINVIKNAVEACSPNKGHVSTTVFKDSENLFIYVKDNGCGMTKEVLDNLEVPFYTTKEKGTGLGVSLSKEIINAHKGLIAYSSSINKGTICKITLPLND